MSEQIWWYVARSGGIVAWVLVTLSILWGLALSTKVLGSRNVPAWLLDLHRWFAALSVVFTAVHVVALVADSYIYFGWSEVFVPMASTYEPGGVAWGIVAFYLLIAIQVSSLMMRKLPRKVWKYVHFSSFVVFAFATLHGQQAGTDVTSDVYRWVGIASVQAVLLLTIMRLAAQRRFKKRAARPAPTAPRPVATTLNTWDQAESCRGECQCRGRRPTIRTSSMRFSTSTTPAWFVL